MEKKQLFTEASRWGEAFPIGNGSMGGMIFGGSSCEKIILSEESFFSGKRSKNNNQEGASKAFYKMREEILEEDYESAHKTALDFIGVRNQYGTNLPVGELLIGFENKENISYKRELDIEHGIVEIFSKNSICERIQKAWCSHENYILVYEIISSEEENFLISYQNGNSYGEVLVLEGQIEFTARAYEKMHCDELCGAVLFGNIQVKTDGEVKGKEKGIEVLGARKTYIYVGMDYESCQEIRNHVLKCSKQDVNQMRIRHKKDVYDHMNRCTLEIENTDSLPADISWMFSYGRYLLLCSSREDSKLPTHLQGVFNDNVACRIGWTCDMHLDINTQMNYWPACVTNLLDTLPPLFRWIEEELVVNGRQTARESYQLEGWVAELVSNPWGFTAPYWAVPISPCPTGGVWILTHMWEYYQTTKDEEFLRKEFYPILTEAVKFFEGYLFEGKDGYQYSGPSISPENSFLIEDKIYQVSNGCTYEILMIRELFEIYMKSYEILEPLGEKGEYEKIKKLCDKLLPYRVLEDGTIAEWSHDYPSADTQHRHTSHLLGVFPFAQITPETTKELAKAAEKTIQKKLDPIENWEDTGWARSMLILYEARLHQSKEAYEHIKSMLQNLLEPNGMIIHPPTRGAGSFDNVYELDGNTGLTSGIAEMLLQSHQECIHLLPALPTQWKSGKVRGLLARGGVMVDISWKDGKLKDAVLCAKEAGEYRVKYAKEERRIRLEAGVRMVI